MAFFTELFARNRSPEIVRYRNAMAMLDAMSPVERPYVAAVRPADYPRLAREAVARGR